MADKQVPVNLSEALAAYDRALLNLNKLDQVWAKMQSLVPTGLFYGEGTENDSDYEALGESWEAIAASLPRIDGWQIEAEIISYSEIGYTRIQLMDLGEPVFEASFEARVNSPASATLKYRHKLARSRRRLVHSRALELIEAVDRELALIPLGPSRKPSATVTSSTIRSVQDSIEELERLLGETLKGGPRQNDLHRHLSYGEPHDLQDIASSDWPTFRPYLLAALENDEDPVTVGVEDFASLAPLAVTGVAFKINWDRIDEDAFERLLVRILESSKAYVRINRLMHVNAADAGRDIEAFRIISDGLLSERQERVIVQAKHWPVKGISSSDIGDLVNAKLPLWEGEPICELIVATTGSFTQDAVRFMDNRNYEAKRPRITFWSSSELEILLRKMPALLAEFSLME